MEIHTARYSLARKIHALQNWELGSGKVIKLLLLVSYILCYNFFIDKNMKIIIFSNIIDNEIFCEKNVKNNRYQYYKLSIKNISDFLLAPMTIKFENIVNNKIRY